MNKFFKADKWFKAIYSFGLIVMVNIAVGNRLYAQESQTASPIDSITIATTKTIAPTPTPIQKWENKLVPWAEWFKKHTVVADKTDYIHILWDAQDFKANFEVSDKKARLMQAAVNLASLDCPDTAKSDLLKVDIVYVLDKDAYGLPKWDSLQQIAHFEFSRTKALKLLKSKKGLKETDFQKIIDNSEFY